MGRIQVNHQVVVGSLPPRLDIISGPALGEGDRNSFAHKYGISESIPNVAESITGAVMITETPYRKKTNP